MKQKLMTLSELCNELSISKATGRNWLRLGKISPSKIINGVSFFDHSYVDNIKRDISSGKNTSLKSRRNKKYKSGFDLYNSYVSGTSPNLAIVSDIIAYIKEQEIETDEVLLRALLGECALKLLFMKRHKKAPSPSLEEFYKNTCEVKCRSLIEDLIGDTHEIMKTVKAHRKLFLADYTYIPTEDTLGLLYISLNNIGKRKSLGAYYTPTEVVNKLCNNLFSGKDFLGKEILDPCCGTGNFLLQLPGNISGEQVYGNDIDEISVRLARINYALKYDVSQKDVIYSHITRSDFLQAHGEKKYDYIIGNPPWGSDKPYDVFVEKAVRSLNLNGHLAFVLPEAILSVKAHKDIRSFMLSCCRFEYVEYLGEVFHKVQCPSIILHARYTNAPFNTKGLVINDMGKRYEIKTDRDISNGFLSFRMTDEEYELINTIENIENKVTLKDQAVFALGIVTGDNKQFISDKKSSGKEPVLKGSDIQKYRYTGSCNYILFEPEKFQQVAPADIYRAICL